MENISSNIGFYITLVGIALVVILGGVCWAKKQIANGLSSEFVTHDEHEKKEKEIVNLIDTKYKEILANLGNNHKEWEREVRRLKEETDKNKEMLIRIDTKVQLLVDDKIKKD